MRTFERHSGADYWLDSRRFLIPNIVNLKTAALVVGFLAPMSAGTVRAADLHPIIEIETGYLFGGSENGKW